MQKIELTYKTLNDRNFIEAMRTLVNHKFDAFTTSYKLSRILDKVDSESKAAAELWNKHLSKLEWTETKNDEGVVVSKKPADEEEYKKMESEFLSLPVDFGKWGKVHVNELIGCKLSPIEMMALEPVLDGLETLEGE